MIIWNSCLAGAFFVFLLQGLLNGLAWYHNLMMLIMFICCLTDAIIDYRRRLK